MESVLAICVKLRELFDGAVRRNLTESILVSGGLDTSIVTAAASRYKKLHGVTVCLRDAPDERFAKLIAERFRLNHTIVRIDENDAMNAVHDMVKVMNSFDPMEVRNDVSILIALRAARDAGFDQVLTGDAGDELFGGYNFLFKMHVDELDRRLADIWRTMRFSSIPLAHSHGMQAKLPFLDNEFKAFTMSIPAELKVRGERGQIYGKWILRKAFEAVLPMQVVWRVKMPIEQGSGTSILSQHFDKKISDDEFRAKKEQYEMSESVRLNDTEHLAYYEEYRRIFGVPRGSGEGSKTCEGSGSYLLEAMNYCRRCGAYLV